jgi:hypothetical protein
MLSNCMLCRTPAAVAQQAVDFLHGLQKAAPAGAVAA